MRSRRGRVILFAVLVMVGIGAGVRIWDLQQQAAALASAEQDLDERFEQMIAATSEIAAAQEAYVAPGQPDDVWFARVSSLVAQLSTNVETARSLARSTEAAGAFQAVTDATRDLQQLDSQVRESLRFGEDLIAADLIFSDGHSAIATAAKELGGIRDAERALSGAERTALVRRSWTLLGGATLLWLAGLLLLVRTPAARRAPQPMAEPAPEPTPIRPIDAPGPAVPKRPPLDLEAAAEVCTAISRMTQATELPSLLARAAAILDASGLIVWMSAGEELFAVAAHGYDARVVNRLGPMTRTADNATAASWRTGQLSVVPAETSSNGAIVAPMFGPETCIGVLAAEVRQGRQDDADARAVTAMIAAQLASAVVAWPASSSPAIGGTPPAAATGS